VASGLLLVPELFFRDAQAFKSPWRWPLIFMGALITLSCISEVVSGIDGSPAAVTMAVLSALFAAYALHFRRPWLVYLATACAAAAAAYALHAQSVDVRLTALTGLTALYFLAGVVLRGEGRKDWAGVLRASGLALGALLSLLHLSGKWLGWAAADTAGWQVLLVSGTFFIEMVLRREDRLEVFGPIFASAAAYLLLSHYGIQDIRIHLLVLGLIWLGADLVYARTFASRRLAMMTRLVGVMLVVANVPVLLARASGAGEASRSAWVFAVYAVFFAASALLYGRPWIAFTATAATSLSLLLALKQSDLDLWLPVLTGLALAYFAAGALLRSRNWSPWGGMFRLSALILGAAVSIGAPFTDWNGAGLYVFVVGVLFAAEMYLRGDDRLEIAAPVFLSLAASLALRDSKIHDVPYLLLAISLIWLAADIIYVRTLKARALGRVTRLLGALTAAANAGLLLVTAVRPEVPALCFGTYALFFAIYAWICTRPVLAYAAAASLPLAIFFELRLLHQANWLYTIAALAVLYYAGGYLLGRAKTTQLWGHVLSLSALGLGLINSASALLAPGSLGAAIPVAAGATLFAFEAFRRRNVWLGFPANLLYFEAYFIILAWLKVDQPQFFSMGAALLGLLMHYLLSRAGSKLGAFLTGLFSQLVLLGTTYLQMFSTQQLSFFVVIFFQAMAVLAYGIVVRSRSLVIAPIVFIVLSVLTVIYSVLVGIATVVLVGCSGIGLLLLGILAVVLRERIAGLGDRLSGWQA
jgi:hypothetical protein